MMPPPYKFSGSATASKPSSPSHNSILFIYSFQLFFFTSLPSPLLETPRQSLKDTASNTLRFCSLSNGKKNCSEVYFWMQVEFENTLLQNIKLSEDIFMQTKGFAFCDEFNEHLK